MSRAYQASIGVYKKQFYTFDFGKSGALTLNSGNGFHIVIADVAALDRPAIKAALAVDAEHLTVGPIQFNLRDCSATFRGCRLGPTTWIATEYADTLIMSNLPVIRDEIVYLVRSLIHLLESA